MGYQGYSRIANQAKQLDELCLNPAAAVSVEQVVRARIECNSIPALEAARAKGKECCRQTCVTVRRLKRCATGKSSPVDFKI